MKIKTLFGALGVATAMAMAPMAAQAVPVSGQLDISGQIDVPTSDFSVTGGVDFNPQIAGATGATGSFAPVVTLAESLGGGGTVTGFDLFDIDFAAGTPFVIYATEAGFAPSITFSATSYGGFDNDGSDGTRGFFANGIISIAGFDDTEGLLQVSTQEIKGVANVSFSATTVVPLPAGIVFLLTALGGLGFVARRRAKLA